MDQNSAIFLFLFSDTLLSRGSLKLNGSGSSNGSKTSDKSPFLGRLNDICCNGTGSGFLLDTFHWHSLLVQAFLFIPNCTHACNLNKTAAT